MFLSDGGACRVFTQRPGDVNAYDIKSAAMADAKNRNSVQLAPAGAMNSDQVFDELSRADDANHIMACWTTKDPPGGAAGRGASGEAIAADGIVKGHAYSLISVDRYHADGQEFRLLRIRNPWGANPAAEWKGDFSDNWSGWSRCPELANLLKGQGIGGAAASNALDGMFWMSWESFLERYSDVGISPCTMPVPRKGKGEHKSATSVTRGVHGKKFQSPSASGAKAAVKR